MAYSTFEEFAAVHEAAAAQETKGRDCLGLAADLVERLAPAPDPEPDDYAGRAARAERAAATYIFNTFGGVSGQSLSGLGSRSFADDAVLRRMIRDVMGIYAAGGRLRSVPVERG